MCVWMKVTVKVTTVACVLASLSSINNSTWYCSTCSHITFMLTYMSRNVHVKVVHYFQHLNQHELDVTVCHSDVGKGIGVAYSVEVFLVKLGQQVRNSATTSYLSSTPHYMYVRIYQYNLHCGYHNNHTTMCGNANESKQRCVHLHLPAVTDIPGKLYSIYVFTLLINNSAVIHEPEKKSYPFSSLFAWFSLSASEETLEDTNTHSLLHHLSTSSQISQHSPHGPPSSCTPPTPSLKPKLYVS